MKQKKRPRSLTAMTAVTALFALAFWLFSMYLMTIATAENFFQIFLRHNVDFASDVASWGRLDRAIEDDNGKPGFIEYRMWETLRHGGRRSYHRTMLDDTDATFGLRGEPIDFQTAVGIYDGNGNPVEMSGDFFYFPYVTEEIWNRGEEGAAISGYAKAPFDVQALSDEARALMEQANRLPLALTAMRFTGVLEDTQFMASKIEYITREDFNSALELTPPTAQGVDEDGNQYTVREYIESDVIREQKIQWRVFYENAQAPGGDAENVQTLYTNYPNMICRREGESVNYNGKQYPDLDALLTEIGPQIYGNHDRYGLNEMIIVDQNYIHDDTDFEYTEETMEPPLRYVVVAMTQASPLKAAVSELRNAYVISFVCLVIGICALRGVFRRNLTAPLGRVNAGIANDWTRISDPDDEPLKWREPYELNRNYEVTQNRLHINRNEIKRLNTALKYAEDAEKNRRQMTSNIAHELKTPLAVIHSYAEGLKEHIAEEKREKYLAVILEETERMDAMVLEMLDLSRLEAGKIKLAQDEFSLSDAAKVVFDRLSVAAQAKNLNVTLDLSDDLMITADEARIEQVISNFLINAIKYSKAGGNIRISTAKQFGEATFAVENDGEPLPNEVLSKVWDTFYRADDARSGEGSGLGLAIAKSIIELHSGRCFASNTKTGVKFGFTIKTAAASL